jgi:(p)ppGpp synthase/HD superfamily hydrolase
MIQEQFSFLYQKNEEKIYEALQDASTLHDLSNKKYGDFNYIVHLIHVLDQTVKYGSYLVQNEEQLIAICVAACFHDVIEDTPYSLEELRTYLTDKQFGENVTNMVCEIVDALTTRGTTRKERHSPAYYERIRSVWGASFVKMSDRLANVKMSYLFNRSLLKMYQKEADIFKINDNEIPLLMKAEYDAFLI